MASLQVDAAQRLTDAVKAMTDLEHWGVIEKWSCPDDGYLSRSSATTRIAAGELRR
jgi:predicted transglutaminase-like cysteine proteinase